MTPALRPVPTPAPVIGVGHKSFPPHLWGVDPATLSEPLAAFGTPLVTLDRSALAHNTRAMMTWARERGVHLAPHGKTTMAPALWEQLTDAGAWGLTLATIWQVQVGAAHGMRRMITTAPVLDPGTARWLADAQGTGVTLICWVDSVDLVEQMDRVVSAAGITVPVLVELGAPGGRTGARTVDAAVDVAHAVERSRSLRLHGVTGYEGSFGHDRSAASVAAVRAYLGGLRDLAERLELPGTAVVSAGGSAYPDLVVDELAPLASSHHIVLRAGAFQVHDDGFYAGISPLSSGLRSAMHGWARVLSTPEPGLAILDGGRRDFSFDEGMPHVQAVRGRSGRVAASVRSLNDQHAYVDQPDEPLRVGEIVRLGLSHPCTVLDKWRHVPVIDDVRADEPTVVGVVDTWF